MISPRISTRILVSNSSNVAGYVWGIKKGVGAFNITQRKKRRGSALVMVEVIVFHNREMS
jgi:hypothetical protein